MAKVVQHRQDMSFIAYWDDSVLAPTVNKRQNVRSAAGPSGQSRPLGRQLYSLTVGKNDGMLVTVETFLSLARLAIRSVLFWALLA